MLSLPPAFSEHLHAFLAFPLLTLAGGVVTPASVGVGVIVFASALFLASMSTRSLRKLLAARGFSTGSQFAVAKIVRYILIALGSMIAAESMGVRLDALLAASTVLAVGIGFGMQNITQNFISGLILLIEQPVRKGDFIKAGEMIGVIEDIGLRATRIVTRDEVAVIVPNSLLITEAVINHSQPTLKVRIKINIGVAYGSDLPKVRETLLRVSETDTHVLHDPKAEVRFEDFGDSALMFSLLVWIPDARLDLRVASDLRFEIDEAFREEKIEIPFPQRDLHLRTTLPAAAELDRRSMLPKEKP
ncbi:MAG: mechanosensitive ion channel domain-containing protein [Polyangiaceae bacterium]